MAALHDALKTLSPTTVSALPTPDTLPGYITNALRDTYTLINSLPPSDTDTDTPASPLQKEWKPFKLNAKDNPHNFSVYKLAAKDGKGTWFARRSVHSQLGFRRFRAGLVREFELGAERGSSVRGVGRERQIERGKCALGQSEINYLTAQFPGPSAPRDFVTSTITSSAHPQDLSPLSDDAPPAPAPNDGSPKPRQFTMISRPLTDHPECAERQGYVRGQFESVEFIREIPSVCAPPVQPRLVRRSEELRRVQSVPSVATLQEDEEGEGERRGRRRGRTITFADTESVPEGQQQPVVDEGPHPEQNPVEWIMITRSDPGGSVPRWMVERGTPGGIVKDADKFLEWAAAQTDLEDGYPEDEESEEMAEGSRVGGDRGGGGESQVHGQELYDASKREPEHPPETSDSNVTPQGHEDQSHGGLLSSAVSAVSAGVSMLTPSVMSTSTTTSEHGTPTASTTTHNDLPTPPSTTPGATTPSHSDDDAASIASFATAPSPDDTTSVTSVSASTSAPSTPEDKALARLLREKAKLCEKLERQRSRERKKRSKDEEREQKLLEKHMKEIEKREARYQKDVEKARKREEKKRSKEMKEVVELKSVVEGLTKENLALRERVDVLEAREKEREREAQRRAEEAAGAVGVE
ncbi:hypothetical protein P167DRAFT_603400 [Morchella conica CCBAS932]|uniref:DUF3074 domain-containing protein n=1 Tax=Morchella conica CCBAS932 TaxID=1392247 RepID=A0A3N4L4F1_9PEZI|nr:hypothetical protein P167DRAFT_603400 [Morchella conica CCBAS932]